MQLTRIATLTALTGVLAASAVTDAFAWSRHGTVSGPRGTASVHAHGNCSGNSCSRSIRRTGPYGYSATRTGSVSCSGHSCSGSRTTTLPSGRTIHRSRSVSW